MTSSSPDPPTWRVSTTFYPGAQLSSSVNEPPDIVLNTIPEEVHFYVHSSYLLRRSINAFAFLISPQTSVHSMPSNPSPYSLYQQNAYVAPSRSESRSASGGSGESSRSNSTAQQMPQVIISVHENADVLNLLLHAVYDISPERYAPSLDTLSRLPGALLNYGYSLEEHIAPGSELTRLFLVYARDQPLEVYALAASYHLEHLAQRASKPSLAAHLTMMTEQQVMMMGSVYLRRLIMLHVNRITSLKRILLTLPVGHGTKSPLPCDSSDATVLRAWALSTAYLAWEAQPDLSAVKLAQILAPLLDQIRCGTCRHNLQLHIATVLNSWAKVKDTI